MKNVTKSVSVEVNEEVCVLEYHTKPEPYGSRQKHTIVSIINPFDPEDFGFDGRPEYSRKGENPELDKAWRKYNKIEVNLQRGIIDQAVKHGMIEEDLAKELKWSRKAGCSCGCSPGWTTRDYRRQSIWLTLVSPSKEQEKKERHRSYAAVQEAKTLSSMVI
jgi:hypothetical protein